MGKMLDSPRATTPTGFDPEGDGYDYDSARAAGLAPQAVEDDVVPHWPTRVPDTGLILKGRAHKTFDKGVKVDEELGYKLVKKGSRYHTVLPTED